jgi:cytochrome c oxidase assembly protein subunit 11
MPVRFFVDPQLPADITTLTLSYRFYTNAEATAKLAAQGQTLAARSAP